MISDYYCISSVDFWAGTLITSFGHHLFIFKFLYLKHTKIFHQPILPGCAGRAERKNLWWTRVKNQNWWRSSQVSNNSIIFLKLVSWNIVFSRGGGDRGGRGGRYDDRDRGGRGGRYDDRDRGERRGRDRSDSRDRDRHRRSESGERRRERSRSNSRGRGRSGSKDRSKSRSRS